MDPTKQSYAFNTTVTLWIIFGLWSNKSSNKFYKWYCFVFVTLTTALHFVFYTLNLIYTPRKIEIFATQAVYYFSSVSGLFKIGTVLTKQQEILSTFEIIDCKEFLGNCSETKKYLQQFRRTYFRYFRLYLTFCMCCAVVFLCGLPLVNYFFRHEDLKLPVCEYYFLTDEVRKNYIFYWFDYQILGLIVTIVYNSTTHTFLCGLILMGITQFKILNFNIANIRLDEDIEINNQEEREQALINKLNQCLKHYDIILKYCENVQNIADVFFFVQFSLAAITICFCMYMLILDLSDKDKVFTTCFISAMLLENYTPSFLGSHLTAESDNLRIAAYSCNWTPRSHSFKKSLILLMERAHRPVVIVALKMVPINLETFASMVKTAYSFFTLLSGAQE